MHTRGILVSSVVLATLAFSAGDPACAGQKKVELDSDKALMVMFYDNHCKKACEKVRPMVMQLEKKYQGRLAVHYLNVDFSVMDAAKDKARRLGILSFLGAVNDWVPCVGVFTRQRRLVRELPLAKKKETYVKFIEKALKKSG